MAFFEYFNKTEYQVNEEYRKNVTNIFNSILVQYQPANNTTRYYYYTVQDNETPEILSHKFYNDSQYHWIFLVMNNIVHPFYDWPMSPQVLDAYVSDKYDDPNEIHHYLNITTDKFVGDYDKIKYDIERAGDFKNAKAWGPNETYTRNDIVKKNGIYYVFNLYLTSDGTTTDPAIDDVNWTQVSNGLPLHISPITNIGYERSLNEEKREIKVLNKLFLSEFVYQYEKLMKSNTLYGVNV